MIVELHELKKQGFKLAAIAKKLEISRNTVYKNLDMTFDEATNWMVSLGRRQKKLDPYRERIVTWLKEHSDLSSAKIEDWLKERFPSLEVGASTIRC